MAYEENGIVQIEADELKEIIESDNDEAIIIDVREQDEYIESHIPGVPLIPMSRIPFVMDELKKEATYIFVCRSGGRSQAVAEYLKAHGFRRVYNFAGGMLTWKGRTKTGLEWAVERGAELFQRNGEER